LNLPEVEREYSLSTSGRVTSGVTRRYWFDITAFCVKW